MKKKFQNLKLSTRISIIFLGVFIPLIIMLGTWFMYVVHYNAMYSRLVHNASALSDFSIDFKNNYDYKIYLIIVGNKDMTESNPFKDITRAEHIMDSLDLTRETKNNTLLIKQNRTYMEKLRTYTQTLKYNLDQGGHYDENIKIWDNDIMTVTSLIQDNILQILHNETKAIGNVKTKMAEATHRMILVSIILVIFIIIYAILASKLVSRTVTKPILYLQELTYKVAAGNLDERSKLETGAEVKKLSDSLNTMIEQIGTLIDRVEEKQIHLREAELEILQNQINPHFLYNTLDTIVWLAEDGQEKQVVKMVEALSSFFRSSLNQGSDMTTIEGEMVHVNSYLEIQKVRYQDILDYDIQMPKELFDYALPKITLQPLVENALYHGIKNKRGKGMITVSGRLDESGAVICVQDNGQGMTQERHDEVIRRLNSSSNDHKECFGTYNVNERLRLKFGDAYKMNIESTYGEGTKVELFIPRTVL